MRRILSNKLIIISISVFILIIVLLVSSYIGDMYALGHLTFKEVTPTQLASAMREDDFYPSYRENTLLFSGLVTSSTTQNGTTIINLKSSDSYRVNCELLVQSQNIKVGETYKFESEAYQAERQPTGVLLHNCVVI